MSANPTLLDVAPADPPAAPPQPAPAAPAPQPQQPPAPATPLAAPSPFSELHDEYLAARAVPVALAVAAGLKSITGAEAGQQLHRPQPLACDGLAIHYPGVTPPYTRVRADDPEAAGARYQLETDQLGAELKVAGLLSADHDDQVQAWIASLGIIVTGTGKSSLADHASDPRVAALLKYRRVIAFLRDLGPKVLAAATGSPDGRVHATFDPLAASTGRFGCSNPNLLGMPKDPAVRRCVIPAPGHVFVVADYHAIDLRVLAEVTGDERLQAVFKSGRDPHRETAALLLNKSPADVTAEERQRAKPVNFGFAFGMGAAGLVDYARDNYGITFTLQEAEAFRSAFLKSYPKVAGWQERMRQQMPLEVRTGSGRRRIFTAKHNGYCERLSTPVQGTAADGMKRAMVLLHQRLPSGARIVLCVHDELLVETPVEVGDQVKEIVVAAMVEGMGEYVKSVPVTVAAGVRKTWAG